MIQELRRNNFIWGVTMMLIISLLSSTLYLNKVLELHYNLDISYLLSKDISETPEDTSKTGIDSEGEFDIFFAGESFSFAKHIVDLSVRTTVHVLQIPKPILSRVIPPPKG